MGWGDGPVYRRPPAWGGGDPRGAVNGAAVAAIEALVTNWRGQGAVQLGGGVRVERRGTTLLFA